MPPFTSFANFSRQAAKARQATKPIKVTGGPTQSFDSYVREAAAKRKQPTSTPPTNRYLMKAKQSIDPTISQPAKAVAGTIGYFDRVFGISASNARKNSELFQRLASNPANKTNKYIRRANKTLQENANKLTQESRTTRIRTGVAVGTLGGAHVALKTLRNQDPNQNYDYATTPSFHTQL